MTSFKRPYGKGEVDDPILFIQQEKRVNPNMKIHVGTDSVYASGTIHYVEVIALYTPFAGGKYIYRKTKAPGYRRADGKPDIFMKLWQEARLTLELADYLKSNGVHVDVLEFDYNNIPEYESHKLISSAKGWALGAGYCVMYKRGYNNPNDLRPEIVEGWKDYKPTTLIAAKAADNICQSINKK